MALGGRYGVFDDQTPVGIAAIRQVTFERARHRATIEAFYVAPSAQGGGAADALMTTLFDHASENGIWQLELFVAAANPRAVAFYERHGFRREGRCPNAIITEDGPQDDWFYVCIPRRPPATDQQEGI
ncbi:N-acetyltransferase family protein [Sedimentitalea sp. XS_ASV28]|uniref:GNAT family N-acetyltransferase n=1 Tax=Sedimentitalea sp. XS_ASV28 TaxID=3241296 RepID=UPI003516C249